MPSLSQKYRPQTFADVTGQAHVTDTLAKEVATGKLGHAFLFCGPRGVGKTTTARIFAKALNCLNPKDGEPDNSCERCVAANEGRQIDLIEMDAATHTGVETVRESIIEHVRFAPMGGARKVYVLDEAHMLSSASWNALLKTLEEPPAYAFFILATTEWHKVPATIVSRCQRFEFKRVQDDVMRDRVEFIAKEEGWKIDEEVTKLVVSRADGCVRDAETLLGQLGGLGEKHLTLDVAQLVIPPGHLPAAAGLVEYWSRRDHVGAINEAQRLADEGLPLLPLCSTISS
jgi:DNA polymerase-3 subunit gamma/tau